MVSVADTWRTFDEDTGTERSLTLFPATTEIPAHAQGHGVQVRLDAMELHRPRQWGACWLATQLWSELQLDEFWRPLLGTSREGTDWTKVPSQSDRRGAESRRQRCRTRQHHTACRE